MILAYETNTILLVHYNSLMFIPTHYVTALVFQQSYKENTLGDQLAGPIGIVKNADQMMLDQVRGVLFLFIVIFICRFI